MKHICFIASAFGREDSLIVYRFGRTFVEKGYKVTYLLRDGNPDEMRLGIEMRSIGAKEQSLSKRIRTNSKLFKKYLSYVDADIYMISEPELLHIGIWLKQKGKIVVFNLREWYPDYYARKVSNGFLKQLVHWGCERYFNYVAHRYDAVFNCMPEMRDYIEKVMPCQRFEDVANFPVVNKDFSLSYDDYCKRKPVISYFGSIYTISCQEEFLDALGSFPDVKYLLAGVFYSSEYQKKVMAKPAWKQVEFINGFTRKQLPGIINRSIMGNVVKDFDQTETPQGSYSIIKIFETMEAAVPVILAKVPLYEQMVEKYHCGICVKPHSVDDFRAAIDYLLTHKEEAYQMGQNGRKAVLEEFSWESQANNVMKVISELTEDRQ
ncbi:MAG: glycosyltransferase [Bacteroidales bacterium]|nr:glycosyltransferase [Bacteroidales bacterium]